MHIRINIPSWGFSEYRNSLKALLLRRDCFSQRLKEDIQSFTGQIFVYLLSSGRFGICAAIKALGLEHPRIAVPAYVCPTVITAINRAQAKPVFIDVQAGTVQFDADSLKQKIDEGIIDAILAPNTYGLDQNYPLLSNFGLPLIEDAAYQSGFTDRDSGTCCGLRGDVGIWSFNFKALTSVGGGVLLSPKKIQSLEAIVHPRIGSKIVSRYLNYFFRSMVKGHIPKFLPGAVDPQLYDHKTVRPIMLEMSEEPMSQLQASLAWTQWQNKDKIFEAQRQNTSVLMDAVKKTPLLKLLKGQEKIKTPHLFPFLLNIESSDIKNSVLKFRRYLYDKSIQTETPYPTGHSSPESISNAFHLASKLILVPCNASLSERQVKKIAYEIGVACQKIK